MSCFYTTYGFHWRKQTLGSLLPEFQLLAISCFASHHPHNWLWQKCQHPPPKAKAMQTASVRLLSSWKHLTGCIRDKTKKKTKPKTNNNNNKNQKKILPAQFPRERMLSAKRDAWPHTAHHPLTLHHLSATAVISITELIYWFFSPKNSKNWSNHSPRDKETRTYENNMNLVINLNYIMLRYIYIYKKKQIQTSNFKTANLK